MKDREAIKEDEFIDDSVKEIALRFDFPITTSQRLSKRVGDADFLEDVFQSNGPRNYLDWVRRRERLPLEKEERLSELFEPTKQWIAGRIPDLHVVHESERDRFRQQHGQPVQYTRIDSDHIALALKSSQESSDSSDGFGISWQPEIEQFREDIESFSEWVEYELRRHDTAFHELARREWEAEKELMNVYREFLTEQPREFQTKKEKVICLKEAFPYLRISNELAAETVDCSKDYARQFKHIEGEGIADAEASSKLKQNVLDRDGERCVSCGADDELAVHHIVPRNQGGANEPDNLATLCKTCHHYAHGGNPSTEGWADYSSVVYSDVDEFWNHWVDKDFSS